MNELNIVGFHLDAHLRGTNRNRADVQKYEGAHSRRRNDIAKSCGSDAGIRSKLKLYEKMYEFKNF